MDTLAFHCNAPREKICGNIRTLKGVGCPIAGDTCEAGNLPTLNWNPPIHSASIPLRHPSASHPISQLPQPNYLSRIPPTQ